MGSCESGVYSSYISGQLVKLSEHCWSDLLVQIKTPSGSSIQQTVIVAFQIPE